MGPLISGTPRAGSRAAGHFGGPNKKPLIAMHRDDNSRQQNGLGADNGRFLAVQTTWRASLRTTLQIACLYLVPFSHLWGAEVSRACNPI